MRQFKTLRWIACSFALMSCTGHALPKTQVLQLQAVADTHPFFGLSKYYHVTEAFIAQPGHHTTPLKPNQHVKLETKTWIGIQGRFHFSAVNAPGATARLDGRKLILKLPDKAIPIQSLHTKIGRVQANSETLDFSILRFRHLWPWLAVCARAIQWALVEIHQSTELSWGPCIIVLCFLIKLLLLPLSLYTQHLQNQVNRLKTKLEPQLAEIKAHYDGEQAHIRIMTAHRALGISPFYALKPLSSSLLQIPILIAVFNALGEMPQLIDAPFLWINSLAYPDTVALLPFTLPLLGNGVNLMPVLMTLITVISTVLYQNPTASDQNLKAQKRNLYLMAMAFLVIFYPFPAGMVLYWTTANLFQLIQQYIMRLGARHD